jgi:uncharacterized protein YfaS (alpha-2-macroglobulin family)
MKRLFVASLLFLAAAAASAQEKRLSVVKAGPVGELATLSEANEVRVVFSEPMVAVGRVPKVVTVPWFHIAPPLKGNFRWSGTTTLIFTPDPKSPLPYATKFEVTIDPTAKSVSGSTLDRPYAFSFTTPTIQLTGVNWYRKGDRYDGPLVIALQFNQPVEKTTIAEHLQLRTAPHAFTPPTLPARDRLLQSEPQQVAAFDAKVAKAQAAASSSGQAVLSFFAADWDHKRFPPLPETMMVVLETKPGIPPDTSLQVFIDDKLAGSDKQVATGRVQTFVVNLAPTFFVEKIECLAACDPDRYNPLRFRVVVSFERVRAALRITDITDPAHEVPLPAANKPSVPDYRSTSDSYSLDELGFSLMPAHTYVVRVDPSLEAADGQKLGYTWEAVLEYWHRSAFISFGDGHGVWEASGGPILPFHARNYRSVQQWLRPLTIDELMPTSVEQEARNFRVAPPIAPVDRKLAPVPDKIQSYGLDLSKALGPRKTGIVLAAIKPVEPIPKSRPAGEPDPVMVSSTVVQVTNLGLTVKDSPQNTLILVTRLEDAKPVAGAKVSIRTIENKIFWSGNTDDKGLAVAPNTDLRAQRDKKVNEDYAYEQLDKVHFIVSAEKDGDVAYVASTWHQGISPWDFDLGFDLDEAQPLLRGTIFADRGVYKPGEEVHLKAVLRSDTPAGMQLLAAGAPLEIVVRDSHDKEVDKRTVALGAWSSADWTWSVPADAALGNYRVSGSVKGQRLQTGGEFLVAAYRRPEFRVDVTLTAPTSIAGTKLSGTITGRYLFGAPMSSRLVKWTYRRDPVTEVPAKIADRFPEEQWRFLGEDWENRRSTEVISTKEQKLNANGELKLTLDTPADAGWPWQYRLEGDVTDVSRQHIAGRAAFHVDPAPWYIGVKAPPYFADADKGIDTAIIATDLQAGLAAGVKVSVDLKRIQWNSVRVSEGGGFYNWQTERKEVDAGHFDVVTQAQPVPLHVPLGNGGQYLLLATASDEAGHSTTTRLWFYAAGGGYTAWERNDHNRIELTPERKTYRPGDTARILIKSPWERATAMLTTEREGVRTWRTFELTSTQQTVTVPIAQSDIPNVFVSVVLLKGRTKEGIEDEADPGKPSFRVGYVELNVEDATKRLHVDVKANRDEYRPASKARIDVNVKDSVGKPSQSEVTLWAVDYGVLSLTAYQTPDVLKDIYLRKSLQVVTDESREKIVSRRVLTPKGESQGGGGGRDTGPGTLRKDFRVLAFWLGSVVTDAKGHARADVTLPESLTTYRVMAVAGDRQSRFGYGQNELRISKPVLVTPTLPRFLALGDSALMGGVIHSQLKQGGTATFAIKSLDPNILAITSGCHPDPKRSEGEGLSQVEDPSASSRLRMTEGASTMPCTVQVPPGGAVEVRANAEAKALGVARIQMSVSLNGEADAIEETIPVRILTHAETVAAYGEAKPTAREMLNVPADVVPGAGGLHLELASTAMVGLAAGAEYLVTYPYGCAEQRSSAALALMLVSDLGEAFALPGVDAKSAHAIAQTTLNELPKFQCGDGGFAFWQGECSVESPYLTANVVHVLQRGASLKYDVSKDTLNRAYGYLENHLKEKRPANEGYWPLYTAWQAFAVKVLAEGGRNVDSSVNRLIAYVDRMPLFGIAFLSDALIARGEKGPRADDLHRRLTNAILPEAGSAHVEELSDPYLLWCWSSNSRSTAIALDTLVRRGDDEQLAKQMVRWLMQTRRRGRWENTQENSWAMEALVDYYRKYESETPDFTAVVTLGSEPLARDEFRGRSTTAKSHDLPLAKLAPVTPPAGAAPSGAAGFSPPAAALTFERQGTGTLFYLLRLKYVPLGILHDPIDQGISVTRTYSPKTFKAGELIKVTLKIRNTKERRFVAVTDPIPAGTEPVESWFATTATDLAEAQRQADSGSDWMSWWRRGGFDHVERHDDRVDLFATRLGEGTHEFTYMLRATTAGTFTAAPAHAEEMYEPEVFGRTASSVVEVKP